MSVHTKTFAVRVQGELACFSAPEFSVERVSYPFQTPSAARGILEAIFWKPACRWVIQEIALLAPVEYMQFRRNEVNTVVPTPTTQQRMRSLAAWDYYADEDRAQRNTVALRNVDYAIQAHMEFTERRGPEDSVEKFEAMFTRRLQKGQYVTPPVLGMREFPATCTPYDGTPAPLTQDGHFGWVLHDIVYQPRVEARFFEARMRQGRIAVPPLS